MTLRDRKKSFEERLIYDIRFFRQVSMQVSPTLWDLCIFDVMGKAVKVFILGAINLEMTFQASVTNYKFGTFLSLYTRGVTWG